MQRPLANMAIGFDRKQHPRLIGEAEMNHFVTTVGWRLVALAVAIAFAADVASTRNEAAQSESAGTQMTAGITR